VEGLDGFADIDPAPAAPEDNWDAVAPPASQTTAQDSAGEGARRATGENHAPGHAAPATAGACEQAARNRADHRVLCIAGRGPLDRLATTLLLQLLGKHDLECRALPHEAASRAAIDSLDTTGVTIVCVFYLSIEGIPSHLRYLVKRLRQRLPHAAIVVGLWSRGDTEKWSDDLQTAMGADCYASSMRDMLDRCRRIAATVQVEPQQAMDDLAA
jgi:hypothetical protein